MHTLGYSFAPWTDARVIADGPSIRSYIRETADAHGVMDHDPPRPPGDQPRSGRATTARWTVTAERADGGEPATPDRLLPAHVQRLLQLRRGLRAGVRRAVRPSAGRSSIPSTGPRTWTTPASAWWSSAAARPRSRSCPAMARDRGARGHGPALADLRRLAARRRSRWPAACAAGCRRWPPTRPCAGRTSPCRRPATSSAAASPSFAKRVIRRGVQRQAPARLRRRHRTSAPL